MHQKAVKWKNCFFYTTNVVVRDRNSVTVIRLTVKHTLKNIIYIVSIVQIQIIFGLVDKLRRYADAIPSRRRDGT